MSSNNWFYGVDAPRFAARIKAVSKETLEDVVIEIYQHLFCDESLCFCPEDSMAANSAADFVQQCDMIFQRLDEGDN